MLVEWRQPVAQREVTDGQMPLEWSPVHGSIGLEKWDSQPKMYARQGDYSNHP